MHAGTHKIRIGVFHKRSKSVHQTTRKNYWHRCHCIPCCLQISYSNSESNVFASLISSKTTSHYNINQVATNFGRKICQALPFFYSFTGCDTVSAFFNQGKCKFWDRWEEFHGHDELTNCFIELSCMPETLSFANVDIIEKYVLFVYYGNIGNSVNINEKRMDDFEHSTHSNLRVLPPSR